MPNGAAIPARQQPLLDTAREVPQRRVGGARDVAPDPRLELVAPQVPAPPAIALLDQPERRVQRRTEIDVLEHHQTGGARLAGKLAAGVATLVAEKTVVVVVVPGAHGHHITTALAPGRSTRSISPSALRSSGTCSSRLALTSASALASSSGSAQASACSSVASGTFSCALRNPPATRSTPIRLAVGMLARRSSSRYPVEHPTSTTVGAAGRSPSLASIARRVHTSMKCDRLLSSWSSSRSSDQLTSCAAGRSS